jgi:hypothetical protein
MDGCLLLDNRRPYLEILLCVETHSTLNTGSLQHLYVRCSLLKGHCFWSRMSNIGCASAAGAEVLWRDIHLPYNVLRTQMDYEKGAYLF